VFDRADCCVLVHSGCCGWNGGVENDMDQGRAYPPPAAFLLPEAVGAGADAQNARPLAVWRPSVIHKV